MSASTRRVVFFVLLLSAAVGYCAWLSSVPLMEPDEARYGEIPREMLHTGDFVTPRLNGVKYFEKPPLFYWLNALSLAVIGREELAVRIWSLLSGIAGVGVTWLLASTMFGSAVANRSALMLSLAPLYVALSSAGLIDPTLTFLTTVSLACFWWAASSASPRNGPWYASAAAAALAVLTKGLIGAAFPVLIAGLYVVASRRWDLIRRAPWVHGVLVFLLIAVPWHVVVALRNPDFLQFYFVHEHLLRYTTKVHARAEPFWFFLPVVGFGVLPWTGFLPSAAVRAWRERRAGDEQRREARRFLWIWVAAVFLFFSASGSKLVPYVLPLVPPLAILLALESLSEDDSKLRRVSFGTGLAMITLLAVALTIVSADADGTVARRFEVPAAAVFLFAAAVVVSLLASVAWWRRARAGAAVPWAAGATGLLFVGLLAVLPGYASGRTARQVAACLAQFPDHHGNVFSFRSYPQSLPFYLDQRIGPVYYQGELAFGLGHLDPTVRKERFPRLDEFLPRWQSSRRLYLIVEPKYLEEAAREGFEGYPVMESARYHVLSNQPVERCGEATATGG